MTWAQGRAFVQRGHHIAPHTHSHRILSRLSALPAQQEIESSIQRVTTELGHPPTVFAYPTGREEDFSERDAGLLRDAGIRCAVSTVPRTATPSNRWYSLPRFSLPASETDFLQYLSCMELLKNKFRSRARAAG